DLRRLLRDLDLDLALLELAVDHQLLEFLARALVAVARGVGFLRDPSLARRDEHALGVADLCDLRFGGRRQEEIEDALIHAIVREIVNFGFTLMPDHIDGTLDQVAHHRLDVAAYVADLRELRRLDLDERRAREFREPARDLGLADTGGADEDDVVGRERLRRAMAMAFLASSWPTM